MGVETERRKKESAPTWDPNLLGLSLLSLLSVVIF
jgi:hypothetical protein